MAYNFTVVRFEIATSRSLSAYEKTFGSPSGEPSATRANAVAPSGTMSDFTGNRQANQELTGFWVAGAFVSLFGATLVLHCGRGGIH